MALVVPALPFTFVVHFLTIISYKSLALKKELKKLIHLVLHAITIALGIIGIYCTFKYDNESRIASLYSLHSWLGIVVISLYYIQLEIMNKEQGQRMLND
ncbi:transmembrane ascorbate ferrireductase 1-like [Prosopis cineraria]|uniref:transmembrane ascorbate ferrireductase 1-like n=1 Tax=Prosopis cineraria TaxID=364024 RepID=UPI00240F5F66|nr:transmembrane ascorbate ferrireductase 1-like [Prosopis cineraria]